MELTDKQIKSLEEDGVDKWVVPVIEYDGELGFEIPDVLMDYLDLKVGDVISWQQEGEGFYLTKVHADQG